MIVVSRRFGINTYSYTQSMRAADCLRHWAASGITAFEAMLYPGHLWITDGAEAHRCLRRVVDDNGLTLTTLNSPNIDLNIAAATPEMRAHCLEMNSAFLRLAGELGAEAVILGPGKANPLFPLPNEVLEGYFFQALDSLLPLARRCGVQIYIENMPFAFLPGAAGLMAALARYGAEDLKVCYDVANAHFIGENPVVGLRTVQPRLALLHLSDTTRAVYRHAPVGRGDLDFAALAKEMSHAAPGRPPILEIISRDPDRDLPQSIASLTALGF